MSKTDRLNVLLTPPEPWQPELDGHQPGITPDPFAVYKAMALEGVDVTLLDPHRKPINPLFGLHPIYMGLDPYRTAKILFANRKVDIVISVFESSCTLPLLFRRLAMYAPLIAMWDIVPEENWKPRKFLQNIVLPRVDHLFLLSSNQQNYIEKRWGCGAKTSVVYQHIDAEFYRPEAPAPDGPIFAIGDDAGRDFDTLIRAVNSLDVHLVAKTRKHLIDLPDRRARIDQISERLSHTDLRKLYADAKFVVVPTYQTENVSGVGSVLESMAMGKAIIVTDNPPLRDFFVDGETAIVVPAGDEAALREAIVHLNDNPEKCLALGQGGRAMVEKKFSNPVLGTRLAQQIRTLVESKSRESTGG